MSPNGLKSGSEMNRNFRETLILDLEMGSERGFSKWKWDVMLFYIRSWNSVSGIVFHLEGLSGKYVQ